MIGTIVLTATITAALCCMLLHHRRSYVYNLEQTNLNWGAENSLLRSDLTVQQDLVNGLLASCSAYRIRLQNEQLNTSGASHTATRAQQRVLDLERQVNELRRQISDSAIARAVEEASHV